MAPQWGTAKAYWREPTQANRERLPDWLNAQGTREQYAAGVPAERILLLAPDTWPLDWALMSRPGNVEVQFDRFTDYRTNVELCPSFQEFFRTRRPPALVVWGKHDACFDVGEAECYNRDLPEVEVHVARRRA